MFLNMAIKSYRGASISLSTLASTGSAGVLAYTTDTQTLHVDQGSGTAGYGIPGSGKAWIQSGISLSAANSFTALQSFTKGYAETVSSSSALATGGTIAITNPVTLVAPTAAVTGVILTSGTVTGQTQTVINNSAYSITFAAVATSHVADGTSDVISARTSLTFIWSGLHGSERVSMSAPTQYVASIVLDSVFDALERSYSHSSATHRLSAHR